MKPKKQASPQTIVVMVAAIIAVVAFAIWNIARSMGSSTPAPAHAATGPPPQIAARAAQPSSPANTATTDGPARTVASSPGGESELAPGSDPFGQRLPELPQQPPQANMQAAPNTQSVSPSTPQAQAHAAVSQYNSLPPLGPAPIQASPAGSKGPAAIVENTPQLVGTMTGDMPSAVFKGEKQLAIVSVGDVFDGWRVLAVTHSGAVVKGFGRTVRLSVGAVHAAEAQQELNSPSAVAEARPNATFDADGRLVQGIAVDPPDAIEPADGAPGNGTGQRMAARPDDLNEIAANASPSLEHKVLQRSSDLPVRVASSSWFMHAEGLLARMAQRNAPPAQGSSPTTKTVATRQTPASQSVKPVRERLRRVVRKKVRRHRLGRHHRKHRISRHRSWHHRHHRHRRHRLHVRSRTASRR